MATYQEKNMLFTNVSISKKRKNMRTRIMTMLAALLLISTGAFAQSGETPLKGDVNEDGKVDVADINAIIKIMKDAGGTAEAPTYYWYAGQTAPTSISGTPTIDDTNFTNNKWHTLSASQISQTVTGGTAGNKWYIAVPTSKGFTPRATDLITPDNSTIKLSTGITVNGDAYDVWESTSTGAKRNVYMK
jgi:hypothetical protein